MMKVLANVVIEWIVAYNDTEVDINNVIVTKKEG